MDTFDSIKHDVAFGTLPAIPAVSPDSTENAADVISRITAVTIHRGTRYQILPTPEQTVLLDAWERELRWLWNLALEQRLRFDDGEEITSLLNLAKQREVVPRVRFSAPMSGDPRAAGRPDGQRITVYQQHKDLTELRAAYPALNAVPCAICQHTLKELDKAWQRYASWRRFLKANGANPAGEPTPKGRKPEPPEQRPHFKRRRDTVAIGVHGSVATITEGPTRRRGAIRFPKLGAVRAVVHRPPEGTLVAASLVRDVDRWYFAAGFAREVPAPAPHAGPAIGLDWGVVNLIADSEGRLVPNPFRRTRQQKRLKALERVISRKYEALKARREAAQEEAEARGEEAPRIPQSRKLVRLRLKKAKCDRKIARQRDYLHNVESTRYTAAYGLIAVERINLLALSKSAAGTVEEPGSNVKQKAGLNREIRATGWGGFVSRLRYKAEALGGRVVEVDPRYSSQECSACGDTQPENRETRDRFHCQACGHEEHADLNAAKVIKGRGEAVAAGLAEESKRKRTGKLDTMAAVGRARKRKATKTVQEAQSDG